MGSTIDHLFSLYEKGINELWLSWLTPILKKTMEDIKQGQVVRISCYDHLVKINQEKQALQEQNEKLKGIIFVQHHQLQQRNELLVQSSEENSELEVQHPLSSSTLIRLDQLVYYTQHGRYHDMVAMLPILEDRCLEQISLSAIDNNQADLSELMECKASINAIIANQLTAKIKASRSTISTVGKFFWRDANENLYQEIHSQLEDNGIDLLIEQSINNEEELAHFAHLIKQLIGDYCQQPSWHQKPRNYASVILKEARRKGLDELKIIDQEAIRLSRITQLKLMKVQLEHIVNQLEADLLDTGSKRTVLTAFFGKKGQEIIEEVVNSPIENLIKVSEWMMSPTTAVAKSLGQAYTEINYLKKQLHTTAQGSGEKKRALIELLKQTLVQVDAMMASLEINDNQFNANRYLLTYNT